MSSALSRTALEFTLQRMIEGRKSLYMWTFTVADVLPVEETARRWGNLSRDLVRTVGMKGVRVFELHSGGHGLHVHVVCQDFHDVEVVREYSDRHGLGRIHVKEVPIEDVGYVAKYVSKQNRESVLYRKRLWAGVGYACNRVRDIVCDGPLKRAYDAVTDLEVCRRWGLESAGARGARWLSWARLTLARTKLVRDQSERFAAYLRDHFVIGACVEGSVSTWGDGTGETDFPFGLCEPRAAGVWSGGR